MLKLLIVLIIALSAQIYALEVVLDPYKGLDYDEPNLYWLGSSDEPEEDLNGSLFGHTFSPSLQGSPFACRLPQHCLPCRAGPRFSQPGRRKRVETGPPHLHLC